MTPTQWVWEAESASIAEEDRLEEYKTLFDIFKSTMIRLLGLNLCPVEDENGRLRAPKEGELIPHSIWACGGESLLGEVLKKNQAWVDQNQIDEEIQSSVGKEELSIEDIDAMFDEHGDIDFEDDAPLNPDWNSDEAKQQRSQLIKTVDVPSINKKSRVVIEEIDEDGDLDFTMPNSVMIESVDEDD